MPKNEGVREGTGPDITDNRNADLAPKPGTAKGDSPDPKGKGTDKSDTGEAAQDESP